MGSPNWAAVRLDGEAAELSWRPWRLSWHCVCPFLSILMFIHSKDFWTFLNRSLYFCCSARKSCIRIQFILIGKECLLQVKDNAQKWKHDKRRNMLLPWDNQRATRSNENYCYYGPICHFISLVGKFGIEYRLSLMIVMSAFPHQENGTPLFLAVMTSPREHPSHSGSPLPPSLQNRRGNTRRST